ncbi:MAG: hypothetical protein P8L32_05300 [Paracoccaceae bacterium]|jgi:hypothetical protein|nr:hypothetical protein [Paracoccaceae bacterium]
MDRDAVLTLFKTLVEPHEGITVKGKKSAYTAVNGNMFAFLTPEGSLCFRYSEKRRAELAAQFGTDLVRQYNSVMRGYVAIPEMSQAEIAALYAECVAFARELPAKPTKR